MKRKIIFCLVAFLLVLQAQAVFAADTYRDFNNAIEEGNFSKAERILKNSANKWSIKDQGYCWFDVSHSSNSTALRTAQLLYQYKVSFDDNNIGDFIANEKSEELSRYLLSIGMPIGNYAIGWAFNKGYSDNFVQLLLEKGGTLNNWALRAAAKNKRWALFPELINKSTEDNINYRQTRDEYTADYNSKSATYKQIVPFNYDPSESRTALMFAAQSGQLRIVKLLVEHGAKVNLRAEGGETAASLAYDNGEIEVYNYLKANGAVDFEPKQATAQPAAPAPSSTTNVYVQPAPAQTAPSQTRTAPATPTLQTGRYVFSGSNVTMELLPTTRFVTLYSGNTTVGNGQYNINGNNITITIVQASGVASFMQGKTYAYSITSDTSFSGSGENWYKR